MEEAEVLGGIFLLMIGILVVAPVPGNGWFIEEFPEFWAIGLVSGAIIFIFGSYVTISGFKSKKKSQRLDTIGAFCLFLSFITLFIALITESGIWSWSLTITGMGLLIAGVGAVLVGERRTARSK